MKAFLATLVLQGLTLPWLIRHLGLQRDDSETQEELRGRLRTTDVALARLDDDGMARLQGAEVLLLDSTHLEPVMPAHLPLSQGLALCRELAVRRPILTHVGHFGLSTTQLRAWLDAAGFPEALIAHDGPVITVDAAGVHIGD